jgi:hypothetical protein
VGSAPRRADDHQGELQCRRLADDLGRSQACQQRHRNERPLRYVPKFFPSLIMLLGGGGRLWLALGGWVYGTVLRRGLPGQFCAPLQLHRGLNRLDALASCSNGLTKRGLEPLIGFDQVRVVIRRGNRRL